MPYSVWNTAPTTAPVQRHGRYLAGSSAHPAKMLPAIAAHAIRRYSQPGDLVLDPMCGIGTTLVEAIHQGRDALGVEFERRWAHLARTNVRHILTTAGERYGAVIHGDARHLPDHVDEAHHGRIALAVTSPPYGNSVHGRALTTGSGGVVKWNHRYGNDPRNLAHTTNDRLQTAFTQILRHTHRLLRPGGTVVVTARPWRERGELVDFPTTVATCGQAAGLTLVERCVALLAGIRDDHLVLRPSFFQLKNVSDARRRGVPLHLIVHEDVLIFRKPGLATHHQRSKCDVPAHGVRTRVCAHS